MEMRISTSWQYQQKVDNMLQQQAALNETQQEVSTGNAINVASDNPAGAGQVVNLNHIIAETTSFQTNTTAATNALDSESSTLSSIKNAYNSIQDLADSAINGSMNQSDMSNIASQLKQLKSQLMDLANSADQNGNALFAGTSTVKQPFQANANGSVTYLGNDSQQRTSVGSNLSVPTNDPGSNLFMNIPAGNGTFTATAGASNTGTLLVGANSVSDQSLWNSTIGSSGGSYTITFGAGGTWAATNASGSPVLDSSGNPVTGNYSDGGTISFNGMSIAMSGTPAAGDTVNVGTGGQQDIFTTINNMISALNNSSQLGDTAFTNQMNAQLESLNQAQSALSNTEVSVGGRLDTLQTQTTAYSDLQTTYQTTLTSVQSANPYQAISDLSSEQSALQASEQVFASVKSMSLFQYIQG